MSILHSQKNDLLIVLCTWLILQLHRHVLETVSSLYIQPLHFIKSEEHSLLFKEKTTNFC